MKTIGLLGGTSWPSTMSYYEALNRAAQEALGGHHSARLLLQSIDYHAIKSLYHHGWDRIPDLLAAEIRGFLDKKPDCFILCNNTLHRALDQIAGDLKFEIPVFHAGHLAADEALRLRCKTVLLLGTAFTMEDGFFARYFEDKGIQVIVPSPDHRARIQAMQTELAKGHIDPSYDASCAALLKSYDQVDAIVLACTELPLVINAGNAPRPLINPTLCQCHAAAQFAYGDKQDNPE